MPRHALRILLAQRLQLVARGAGKVTCLDLVGKGRVRDAHRLRGTRAGAAVVSAAVAACGGTTITEAPVAVARRTTVAVAERTRPIAITGRTPTLTVTERTPTLTVAGRACTITVALGTTR
ncbi:hypothetical protein GCM10010921_22050 [Microbacterium album]|uniref:Uncharacterized protein n=1 Tax=Microbacterium album TaxID=2053191 RepID=A0A917IG24_9MICO|nr:hypothetical protein GCM10010921_22050 [Microbacterium album]